MSGGHECRAFFFSKVTEFANWLAGELPNEGYTDEEVEAGFKRLSMAFGFYATLDHVARYVGKADEEVILWPLGQFYTKLRFLAWRAHAQKEYSKLLNKKKD